MAADACQGTAVKSTSTHGTSMRANQDPTSDESLRQMVERGWHDLDAGRIQNFDPESIKQRGRARLAQAKKNPATE
jgi:hypothetical protein